MSVLIHINHVRSTAHITLKVYSSSLVATAFQLTWWTCCSRGWVLDLDPTFPITLLSSIFQDFPCLVNAIVFQFVMQTLNYNFIVSSKCFYKLSSSHYNG